MRAMQHEVTVIATALVFGVVAFGIDTSGLFD